MTLSATAHSTLYMLDTNILVHYARGKAVAIRIEADYTLQTASTRPLISIVSVAETCALARKWNWGPAKVAALNSILGTFVSVNIDDPRILDAYVELAIGVRAVAERWERTTSGLPRQQASLVQR